MHVAELWRYPIKSLKGEQIQEAQITSNGIPGDREIVVLNSAGRIITSRTRPKLLPLTGNLGPEEIPPITASRWTLMKVVKSSIKQSVKMFGSCEFRSRKPLMYCRC